MEPKSKERVEQTSIRVSKEQWNTLQAFGGGNAAAGLRQLINSINAITKVEEAIQRLYENDVFGVEMVEKAIAQMKK